MYVCIHICTFVHSWRSIFLFILMYVYKYLYNILLYYYYIIILSLFNNNLDPWNISPRESCYSQQRICLINPRGILLFKRLNVTSKDYFVRTICQLLAWWARTPPRSTCLLCSSNTGCSLNIVFFSKNSRKFATSSSPAIDCYWLYKKLPANRSDCTLALRWELWRSLTAM